MMAAIVVLVFTNGWAWVNAENASDRLERVIGMQAECAATLTAACKAIDRCEDDRDDCDKPNGCPR